MKKLLRQFSSDEFEALIRQIKGGSDPVKDPNKPIDFNDLAIIAQKPVVDDSIMKNFEMILDTMVGTNKILSDYINTSEAKKKEISMEQPSLSILSSADKAKQKLSNLKLLIFGIKQELKRITDSRQSGGLSEAGVGGLGLGKFNLFNLKGLARVGKIGAGVVGGAAVGYAISSMSWSGESTPDSVTSENMKTLYNAFIRQGMTEEGAKTMIAQINRENNFQENLLFGSHIDPANGAINAGIISWQGTRGAEFLKFMESRGLFKDGKIVRSKQSLEAQAEFLVNEMKTNKEYRASWESVTKPGLRYEDIQYVVGKNYIKWRIDDPLYNRSGYANQNRGYQQISTILNQSLDSSSLKRMYEFIAPGMSKVGDGFGARGGKHDGIDLPGVLGSDIKSIADGTVIFAGIKSGYGYRVEIDHGNGKITTYSHLMKDSIRVSPKQKVERGTVIGLMGSTGRSTGPHLHFEVIQNGRFVDPGANLGSLVSQTKKQIVVQPVVIKDPLQRDLQQLYPSVLRTPPQKPKKKEARTTGPSFPSFFGR